jgi:YHS domain-containing protein
MKTYNLIINPNGPGDQEDPDTIDWSKITTDKPKKNKVTVNGKTYYFDPEERKDYLEFIKKKTP